MRLEGADYQWRKIHPENCRLIQKLTNDLAGRKSRVDLFCLKPTVHGPVLALSTDRDTPLHVGNWVINGPMTVIAKMTFMTHFADPEADFAVLHNLPNCDIGRPLNSPPVPRSRPRREVARRPWQLLTSLRVGATGRLSDVHGFNSPAGRRPRMGKRCHGACASRARSAASPSRRQARRTRGPFCAAICTVPPAG